MSNSVPPLRPNSNFIAEADKLRDMILTKEGENNQLKEKITSLQEDIDTVRTPPTIPVCHNTPLCVH